MQNLVSKLNTAIRVSFYVLFFMVPLVMWPDTFELFEFNKMWLVFGMSVFIAFLWGAKMLASRRFEIRRTPLDIPLALFFLSQLISTLVSLDPHVSFWGYYSRFNGGLLSTIAYIFLYYAFATNLISPRDPETTANHEYKPISYKLLVISLLSGLAVTLWGIPSHFGLDPTCLVFRGSLDVSCWTADFQPTVRIFSTLGQPNWMGTYLAALIPIALGMGFVKLSESSKKVIKPLLFLALMFIFYIALIWTRSQSSFLGFAVGVIIFFVVIIFQHRSKLSEGLKNNTLTKYILAGILIIAATSFIAGTPIESINKYFTLSGITSHFVQKSAPPAAPTKNAQGLENNTNIQLGGSESSKIRLIVWQGAIEIFKQHPLFGSGVETYAYAYYGVKPLAHNLTSEWDFLYNKAHNEYLNYLATTGIFGLGTYLLIFLVFYYHAFTHLFKKREGKYWPISAGLIAALTAMLISNFFGFSVVVINLFTFIFPILFFDLEEHKVLRKTFSIPKTSKHFEQVLPPQTIGIVILGLIALYFEFFLLNFWSADRKYALGYNLDHAQQYAQAFQPLTDAVKMLPQEDLYKDELSVNMATISLLLAEQKQNDQAVQFAQQAQALSDAVTSSHPQNIVFLKTRVRVEYALSDVDPKGVDKAIATVELARKLAPTDAKLVYNEGLFYQQKGDIPNAIKYIDESLKLKPNYEDALITLALIYQDMAKKGGKDAASFTQKERDILTHILNDINPTNATAKNLLKNLK